MLSPSAPIPSVTTRGRYPRTLDEVELFEAVCLRMVHRGSHRTDAFNHWLSAMTQDCGDKHPISVYLWQRACAAAAQLTNVSTSG